MNVNVGVCARVCVCLWVCREAERRKTEGWDWGQAGSEEEEERSCSDRPQRPAGEGTLEPLTGVSSIGGVGGG